MTTMWVSIKAHEPQREQVYLVFSPEFGYNTLAWDQGLHARHPLWRGVTHWAAFDFLPRGEWNPETRTISCPAENNLPE